uniref:Uncharacterized protein n=1 Tax=Kalanchoe fedtschenkoi TaxID=63787 RepID=A0A7N0TSQ4_KALFE
MAGAGDGMSANFAGMSKNQLYDIMCQMKQLIEQNQQQARQILVQNPLLTRALFQAQIMLGMLQPPQVVPSNHQPAASQNLSQSAQLPPQPVIQPSLPQGSVGLPDQPSMQGQLPPRQVPNQLVPNAFETGPPITIPSPSISLQHPHMAQQAKGHLSTQIAQMPLPHASQVTNAPPSSYLSISQPSSHQSQTPVGSNPMQQPFSTNSMLHPSMQPPLPSQPRPPLLPNFHHQPSQQIGPGFHHSTAPQMLHSQSTFHSAKPPSGAGSLFSHGHAPPLPNQLQPQSFYQAERGTPWMPGPGENALALPGPPPLPPNPMAPGNQAPRPPPMTPEMEKALLQQVMSLTPEQINLLPPDQRQQVLQLQQMLRQ